MSFCIGKDRLTNGAKILETNDRGALLELDKEGAGILIPEFLSRKERYFIFKVKVLEEHSVSMNLLIYGEDPAEPVMNIRFGILPKLETQMCIDRTWFEGNVLFPENLAGDLKIVCHGRRIAQEEITRVELSSLQAFHNQKIVLTDLDFVKEAPEVNLTDEKLVDAFGQNKRKEWKEKIHSEEELKEKMNCQLAEQGKLFPFADWSKYGGWTRKKLTEGTGFFSRIKEDNGKWWLVDPLGYAFLSIGPDCVGPEIDCRIDGLEKNLDWLPSEDDSDYGVFFQSQHVIPGRRRNFKSFSYSKANLYRVWGEKWKENWRSMIVGQLKAHGMNTLGNWSSDELFGTTEIPYVTSLPEFPTTKQNIFRDFPDVFNEEYEETAKKNAQELAPRANDPWMIGYFLRNEPSWAFVDNLVLADETLYNPARTSCKEKLIARMEEKYQSIDALNKAWNTDFVSFADLYRPQKEISKRSDAAKEDMRAFSRDMLRRYVEIPARACRAVDQNHMILGMRWAWISDPDLVEGWENFDVFSINCYAVDPTSAIQNIVDLGVDLPVMIGEFHFGALDAGLPATGLEGVLSQRDRGIAYCHYCEKAAAHPNGVGCHYFQCYDQFVLGRFDGENYNIGLFDICSQPYPDMMEQIKLCSSEIYEVADGQKEPCEEKADSIPMIAY